MVSKEDFVVKSGRFVFRRQKSFVFKWSPFILRLSNWWEAERSFYVANKNRVGRKVVEERKVIRANVIKKCHKKLISFCCPAFHKVCLDFRFSWKLGTRQSKKKPDKKWRKFKLAHLRKVSLFLFGTNINFLLSKKKSNILI